MSATLGADEALELRRRATRIRLRDLRMVYEAGLGHPGGEFRAIDILTTLYFGVLRYDPARPDDPERDRFVLSKGHARRGALRDARRGGLSSTRRSCPRSMAPLSRLNGHPDRNKVPGVETNTGPLGPRAAGGRRHRPGREAGRVRPSDVRAHR